MASTSDLALARAGDSGGGHHNLMWSLLGHAVVIGAAILWPRSEDVRPLRQVMTVNLTGATGPRTGGMTDIGGAAPAPVRPKPTPPAPVPPPPGAAPTKSAIAPPKPAARSASPVADRPVTPADTEPVASGSAPIPTGAKGQGFGLSSSGGAGASRSVELDVSNFCCPEYLERVVLAIQRGWNKDQGVGGTAVVTFTIRRNGVIDGVSLRRGSGLYALDNAAMRAVASAERLPPLPGEFSNPSLTIHLTFEYPK